MKQRLTLPLLSNWADAATILSLNSDTYGMIAFLWLAVVVCFFFFLVSFWFGVSPRSILSVSFNFETEIRVDKTIDFMGDLVWLYLLYIWTVFTHWP